MTLSYLEAKFILDVKQIDHLIVSAKMRCITQNSRIGKINHGKEFF